MKKWIIGIAALIALAILCIYQFIPSQLTVSTLRFSNNSPTGTYRTLASEKTWPKWFPQSAKLSDYTVDKRLINTLHVTIRRKNDSINSIIQVLPIAPDSTGIQWECKFNTSNNPFQRLKSYSEAVDIKNEMDEILTHLLSYVAKPENIYGFAIERTTFTDTLLLTTKITTSTYPALSQTYQLINLLKSRAAQQKAEQTGYPMTNITQLDSNKFQLMVGLPVNRVMEDSPPFLFRRMIPGSFMKAEVKGGPSTVKEALHQMQIYFSDYRKTSMAIPFEYHVTDRMAQPDTSQWITRIYAPVY